MSVELAALYEAHYTPLLRAAWLLLGDKDMAEEVVQEAFLRMHSARRRVRQPDRAPAYLRSITMNLARGLLRRQEVARRRDRADVLVPAERPDDEAVRSESQRRVVDALRTLPGRQRECVVLRYYLNLSERETAEALGIANGSVKSHTSRALAALESRLEDLR